LFLYSYEAVFILLKKNEKKLVTFRYIDDVLSLNNSRFGALLAATLYQGNPDRSHKLWNIVSIKIYIYTPYAGAVGMLLHINGKFTMGILKSSLLS
jgi:hypothetical protein